MKHTLKFSQNILLLILLLLNISHSKTITGRRFKSGDSLPDNIVQHLKENLPESVASEWKLGFCVFTKNKQHFSDKMKEEFITTFSEKHQDLFPVWEFNSSYSETGKDDTSPGNWLILPDQNYDNYDAFGVKVYPTIFIIDGEYKIIGYITGHSPAFHQKIYPFFTHAYPEIFPEKKKIHIASAEDKSIHRKENLIKELYNKKMYTVAKLQIMGLDTLSREAQLLHGKINLQLDDNDSAEKIFKKLLPHIPGHAHLGLGIAYYQMKKYEEALVHLEQVKTIPNMYKVHYWKAKVFNKLGETTKSVREYKKTVRQMLISGSLDPI